MKDIEKGASNIKVCILAAGSGSRLKMGIPKAIANITANYTILDLQIESLRKILNINLEDIIVVVGYKKQLIMEKYPELSFISNNDYQNTGTAKSLLKGLQDVQNSDVLWINGDVVFDSDVLNQLIKNKEYNVVMADNRHSRKEEIKYSIGDDGFIKEVSKNVKNSLGELIGINLVKEHTLPAFISNLEKSADLDYFDKAIQKTIEEGFKFIPLNIGNRFSIEIDYPHELEIAQEWVENNNSKTL